MKTNLGQVLGTLQKANLDTRIHLIVDKEADEDAALPPPAFRFPRDSHDALTHVTKTLSGAYKNFYRDVKDQPMLTALPFRDGAKLEVLVISDDDGENEKGAFDPKTLSNATVSGIIGLRIWSNAVLPFT